jgi:hypothetical protein
MDIRYSLNMNLPDYEEKINYKDSILFLGSCFSENIYAKLKDLNIDVHSAPNGIVFNSFSIAQPFSQILSNQLYNEESIVHHDGLWHGLNHHGSFSNENLNTCLNKMNHELISIKNFLNQISHVFITIGTSYAYYYTNLEYPVANCHKIPQNLFEKKCLSLDTQLQMWNVLLVQLHEKYPQIKFTFTVSPVKHLKDGVVENVLSKSILIQLCHSLKEAHSFVNYFPAFELVNEDLRDYRFFENDGAHPSPIAVQYVFNKLIESMFDSKSQAFVEEVSGLLKFKNHRIINASDEQKQKHDHQLNSMVAMIHDKFAMRIELV